MGKTRIILSEHVIKDKIPLLKSDGWNVNESTIKEMIKKPKWRGTTVYKQPTAMGLLNDNYILRIVFNEKDGIIFVVTVHTAKRGRYESTK